MTRAPSERRDAVVLRAGHARRLQAKLGLVRPRLATLAAELWDHPRVDQLLSSYLVALHGVVRASVPLMETALVAARELASADAVAAGMLGYLERHIEEERGHDRWLLEDLEALGLPRGEVLARVPADSTARAVGAQYYWARHVHPVALLGYIAVLEGDAPSVEFLDELRTARGVPEAGLRTLYKHARLDVGHRLDLHELVERLPLEPWHESLVGVSVFHTAGELSATLADVAREPPAP